MTVMTMRMTKPTMTNNNIYKDFTNYTIQLRICLVIVISHVRTQAEFQVSHLMENEMANQFYSMKFPSTALFFQDIGENYEICDF